jgi:hypothetical protein
MESALLHILVPTMLDWNREFTLVKPPSEGTDASEVGESGQGASISRFELYTKMPQS